MINAYGDLNWFAAFVLQRPAIELALEGSGKKGKVVAAVFDEEQGTSTASSRAPSNAPACRSRSSSVISPAKLLYELATKGDAVQLPPGNAVDTGVNVITRTTSSSSRKTLLR